MRLSLHLPLASLSCLLLTQPVLAADTPPAKAFKLTGWKLQIPGPQDIKDIGNYSSPYFYLNSDREMCFDLNAEEKGTTKNTKYVRSELRHMLNWKTEEHHTLYGEVRAVSKLSPDKVTVMQIHGITDEGENAPPFLRIALNNGDLYAVVKTANSGDKTESILLKRGVRASFVKVGITVGQGKLAITVNGDEMLKRDVSYWKFSNYFKAGCYPQAKHGTVQVMFRKLTVE